MTMTLAFGVRLRDIDSGPLGVSWRVGGAVVGPVNYPDL